MLGRLIRLGPSGWWDLAEAQFWVLHALFRLRTQEHGTLVRTGAPSGRALVAPTTGDLTRAEQAAKAVDRVARLGVGRPLCLARSLALQSMLERRGLTGSAIRVGVRGAPAGLSAHAWVEWDGHVLGDRPDHVAGYRRLETLTVGDAAWPTHPADAPRST